MAGSHDGYNWFSEPATHRRSILFLKNNYWVLRDEVESLGPHQLYVWFHLGPRVAPLHSKDNTVRIISENGTSAVLQMAAFSANGAWVTEPGWVSECYGEKREAPVFRFSVLANGSEELVTFLLPEVAGHKPRVREIEALNGRAFEVQSDGKHDVLLLRDSYDNDGRVRGWIETARLASDFDIAWVRFDRESSRTPDEFILINGHTLEFEGRALLRSTKKISYLAARRAGDRFHLDTEEGSLEIVLPVADLEEVFANLNEGIELS